ncbi:MAG: leucine-rich repeat protein [Clostridia bacterium]|nr:leucine-rich repeat protein [Clostridia bacterium]
MKKTNKIILASSIVAVLLLGIGYAAIQNITLNISGSAAADPSQSNFKVMFSGTPTVSDDTYVTAAITDDTNATVNVEGLTKKGDVVTATYTVQNASTDLSADLAVSTTNSNTEYFTLMSELDKSSLVAGEATTLTVTVELTKTPIVESVSTTIGVQLEAMPVQPGEEGTSEGINDFAQTPDERNEFGFYFNQPYVTTIEGVDADLVFYEDGSASLWANDAMCQFFEAGSLIYSKNKIVFSDSVGMDLSFIVSDYGDTLTSDGELTMICTLNKVIQSSLQPGIYVADPNNLMELDYLAFFEITEDGSMIITVNGKEEEHVSSEIIEYYDSFYTIEGETYGHIYPDGTKFSFNTGDGEIAFVNRDTIDCKIPFGKPYVAQDEHVVSYDTSWISIIFNEDGSYEIYTESGSNLNFSDPAGTLNYLGNKVYDNEGNLLATINNDNTCTFKATNITTTLIDTEAQILNTSINGNIKLFDEIEDISETKHLIIPETYVGLDGITYEVKWINQFSLGGYRDVTRITLSSKISAIDIYSAFSFAELNDLTEIIVDSNNENYCSVDGILYNKDKTKLLFYSSGKKATTFTIPSGVTSIGSGAFMNNDTLTSVIIPESVTNIDSSAFSNCENLTTINYTGSEEQWNSIKLNSRWYHIDSVEDEELSDKYTVVYNYDG